MSSGAMVVRVLVLLGAVVGFAPSASAQITVEYPRVPTPHGAIMRAGDGDVALGHIPFRQFGLYKATIWDLRDGTVKTINPPGFDLSWLHGGNRAVQVGIAGRSQPYYGGAAMWRGTAESCVLLQPAGSSESQAYDGDERYQVGYAVVGRTVAAVWQGSAESFRSLHPGPEFSNSLAYALHGNWVGGFVGQYRRRRAGFWRLPDGQFTLLDPPAYLGSQLNAIHETTQGGYAIYPRGLSRAFIWRGSIASGVDLHPSQGYYRSEVLGINERIQVGVGLTGRTEHALLWSGSRESMINLHDYVESDFESSRACAIDENGVVFGYGKPWFEYGWRPIVWTTRL